MSLSSAMFSGTSGLKNTSKGLQVTSNNIANTKTLGFKKGRTTFADTFYQTVGTRSGAAQIGLGTSVGSVSRTFGSGSFQTTSSTTDMAISGKGFFVVAQPGSDKPLYTRAGNFSFNKNGALTTPGGYIVQGWNLDAKTGDPVGAVTGLVLKQFTSPPEQSTKVTLNTNLNADAKSKSPVLSNSYDYNVKKSLTMGSDTYEYPAVIKVYDSLGSAHDVSVYYDKKSDTEWEYVIASDAKEDKRSLVAGTSAQGLLARGTITFSKSSGKVTRMTMEKFTGRVGNVSSTGVNSRDDIKFEIKDSESMPSDGYGIKMAYENGQWNLDKTSLPDSYKNAKIISLDSQNIQLVMDSSKGESEADLKIRLKQAAVEGDTFSFDVNDPEELQFQGLKNVEYSGSAKNNTIFEIPDPSVMRQDAKGCGVIWNPITSTWHWSNPKGASAKGSLITNMSTNASAAVNTDASVKTVINPEDIPMKIDGVKLRYDNRTGRWDWNETLKKEDFANVKSSNIKGAPSLSIIDAGKEGAIATRTATGDASQIQLSWNGTAWAVTGNGNTNVVIDTANSDDSKVRLKIYSADPAKAATVEYSFDKKMSSAGGETFSFEINPSPPKEYKNAEIEATANKSVAIDFNGNGSTDFSMDVTSGKATALAGGETFSFNVNPDLPPAEYANATLSGDKNGVRINLDSDEKDDLVFSFKKPLTDESVINFDIEGSTAWQKSSTDEAKDTGSFKFTTDFLGGEFGTTEMDLSFDIGTLWDGNNWVNGLSSTTQYARASSTLYQDADGYPPGDLTRVTTSADGTITGHYSNGQQIPLFMVGLANFNNPNGLESRGGNLFAATRESGSAVTNKAGNNGLGEIKSNSLEMSNVDSSDEFVSLIELQNAYEADAKIISTVDEMMTTVIQMKR